LERENKKNFFHWDCRRLVGKNIAPIMGFAEVPFFIHLRIFNLRHRALSAYLCGFNALAFDFEVSQQQIYSTAKQAQNNPPF